MELLRGKIKFIKLTDDKLIKEMMNKIFWSGLFLAVMAGCASPKYSGSIMEGGGSAEIVIINDKETRAGFQEAMENWLKSNNYNYVVTPDNSEHVKDKINLEYIGLWSWDFAIFLADAHITAFHNGQKVGHVEYKASNNLNFSKWGSGEKRIWNMMDILFGKKTPDEANK